MFSWLLRSSFKLLLLASFGAFAVMVPVGRRTLLGHASAIWATRPAQQLREDLVATGGQVSREIAAALRGATDTVAGDDSESEDDPGEPIAVGNPPPASSAPTEPR